MSSRGQTVQPKEGIFCLPQGKQSAADFGGYFMDYGVLNFRMRKLKGAFFTPLFLGKGMLE